MHARLGGLVGLELGLGGLERGLGRVAVDHRAGVLGEQLLVARHVALGLGDLRLVLADLGLDLAELCFQRARIELEEDVALFHQRAFLDIHLHDLAVDTRLDLDRGDGLHSADRVDHDRHRLLVDLGDDHGDRPARVQSATAALRLRRSGGTGRAALLGCARGCQTQFLRHLITIDIASSADRNRDHRENRQTDHPHPRTLQIPSP